MASDPSTAQDLFGQLEQAAREMVRETKTVPEKAPAPAPAKPKDSVVETRLKDLHPDTLTPREALDLIYELKGLAG